MLPVTKHVVWHVYVLRPHINMVRFYFFINLYCLAYSAFFGFGSISFCLLLFLHFAFSVSDKEKLSAVFLQPIQDRGTLDVTSRRLNTVCEITSRFTLYTPAIRHIHVKINYVHIRSYLCFITLVLKLLSLTLYQLNLTTVIFFPPRRNSLSRSRPPRYRGFTFTLRHSVGLLWTNDQPDAETST
jgi:hypothetical protein